MSFSESKKAPLFSVPFLKKRLRRITALGIHNLTFYEFNFNVHFTLHRNEKTIAFYTSEFIENQRSPEWSYLKFPLNVQCLQEFVMRIWITSADHCQLFLEYDIHLDNSLIPDEQKETVNKGNNNLWLEICGYRFTDSDDEQENLTVSMKPRPYNTKSYNKLSILRMNNAIQAIRTEKQISSTYLEQLQTSLDANKDYLSKIKERESRRFRIETLKEYLDFQTYLYQQRLSIYQQKQKILEERKNQLKHKLSQLHFHQEEIKSCNNQINQSKSILRNFSQIINYRQKEIISEIYRYIYPIESDNYNELSIANIKLPPADDKIYQSASSRERDQEITAAIGFCCQLIIIISQFLHLPLRYPIECYGIPITKIYDYSSETSEYLLHPMTNLSAFRYGFYLLNRNIGQMMYHCRIADRNLDLRNTLENLKELIEQHFINSTTNKQIQLYPSIQLIKSVNSIDEQIPQNQRNLTNSSTCSSSSLSLIENEDNDNDELMELYPQFNPMKPRLAIQISQKIQY